MKAPRTLMVNYTMDCGAASYEQHKEVSEKTENSDSVPG